MTIPTPSSSCLVIAGEQSGEEHVMTFLPALLSSMPHTRFFGVGGDGMKKSGVHLYYHLEEFSGWGIGEVILRLPFYMKAYHSLLNVVDEQKTKMAILVDFQTFNLKLAKDLKKRGVFVFYFVAPQAWAWKSYRVSILSQVVGRLYTILPFEKEWFLKRGVSQVVSIPHPLLERFSSSHLPLPFIEKPLLEIIKERPLRLLLLPGSRMFEVKHLLPIFYKTICLLKKHYALDVSLVCAPTIERVLYDHCLMSTDSPINVQYFHHGDLELALKNADLAIAASGTVTLACALFSVPTVVCYKASLLTEWFYESFIDYRGPISLANIVHCGICYDKNSCSQDYEDWNLFPEFIQQRVDPLLLKKIIEKLIVASDDFLSLKKRLQKTVDLLSGEQHSLVKDIHEVMKDIIR